MTLSPASATMSLARELKVSNEALNQLGVHRDGNSWKIPERDADGQIVGYALRFDDGSKGFVKGGRRGLTFARSLGGYAGSSIDDPIFVVEGMSDCAAGVGLGCAMVGRSSATSCKYLPQLLSGRHVVVVGENDGGAGRQGAEKIAAELVPACATVRIIYPPNDIKDLRAWCNAPVGLTREELLKVASDAETLMATRVATCNPKDPVEVAQQLISMYHMQDGVLTLRYHRKQFHQWTDGRYQPFEDDRLRTQVYGLAVHAKPKGNAVREPINKAKVDNIIDALRSACFLDGQVEAPAWLLGAEERPDARELLVHMKGMLHLPTRTSYPPSPVLFVTNALPYAYDCNAKAPEWERFLKEIWPEDTQAVATLQEWFGYLLSADTKQQKMLLVVGPKRSGKGTIGRVVTAMLGKRSVAAPTLSSLSEPFGLAPLQNKLLAIISDARLSGRSDQAQIVERLLSISGEDSVLVNVKHRDAITIQLPTRFMILANELPRLSDSAGALAGRFIVLKITESFFGREDRNLTERLICELPGILNWAIEGWIRLNMRGSFEQPKSSSDLAEELEDLGSPVGQFVRECCDVGPEHAVEVKALYEAWRTWCRDNGYECGQPQSFGRDLLAVVPKREIGHPRQNGSRIRIYRGIGLKS